MSIGPPPEDPPAEEPGAAEAGDLLAAWIGRAGFPPEVDRALMRWLDRELKEDQYARLEQAGHSVEDAIPLAPVFIDLEALPSFVEDPPAELSPANGFLYQALGLKPRRLNKRGGTKAKGAAARRHSLEKGLVLIGGPGQGKSTVGQILCQIHRAALLAPRAAELPRDGHKALDALRAQFERDAVRVPAAVLLPLRIVLRDFAAWMAINAVEQGLALLGYLAHLIRRASGYEMDPADIGQFLVQAPCLLLLDGLDEVPASAGRDIVLAAVRDFLQRQGKAGALGVIIATTRPQGYSGEFGAHSLDTLYLVPLSTRRALAYAARLVGARYSDQPDRQERILRRLLEASGSPATARLMRTPLQVTILAALVDRFGRPPEERWGLFHGYFRVIYEREMERPGLISELLRSHRRHIEQIHARVGLLLQVETERSGGTASLMTRQRLEQVVDATLAEDDDDPERRARLTRTILDAAENRLVFLVSPQDGKIGFEIRSLQEMMAAWALGDKTDAVVEARLVQIAHAANFRNVLLFMASRCFAERSDLRDAFTARICPQLNEADEVARAVLAGSMLALEILEDRSALSQPKHQRALASLALRLLELPPGDVHRRLAVACTGDAEALLRTALEETLGRAEPAEQLSGWVALIALVDRGVVWAREIADLRWPEDTGQRHEVAECLSHPVRPAGEWLQHHAASTPDLPVEEHALLDEPALPGSEALVALAEGALSIDWVNQFVHDTWGEGRELTYHKAHLVVDNSSLSSEDYYHVLVLLLQATPRSAWWSASAIVTDLEGAFFRTSGIDDPATWTRLSLPLPLPGSPPTTEPPPSGHVGPIEHLDLQNLRLLERLTVDPRPRTDGDGQWIILLGDNGVGKTTILRAIALALVEPELATILLSKLPAPLRRRGAPIGRCHVHTRGGDFHTDILEKGDLEVAQTRKGNPARRPLIFGYGCRRGSALGGPAQNVSFSPPTLELATLFDESASLIHAETWLKERALEAAQNEGKPKEALFHAVLATLTGLLPDAKSIEVRDNRVWVDVRDAGWVPLAALSDGYITTAGWVIDLVARWIDRATRHGEALKPDFTKSMEGFVLVDEIDLHLHPRWQCEVIANLRRTFPKMSFVVTTHNPLTLLGAEDGEIFVLDRASADGGAEGPVTIEQVDLPKGARADQVLTGRWFGLPYAYDRGTVGLLEQHQGMLLGGTPGDDPARVALEEELRKRLGTFADTALDRMALSVAAELMSEQKPISAEDRGRLREQIKERLRAKLAERSGSSE